MTVPFVKMHGAGNDFVMLDDRAGMLPDDAAFVRRLANRPDGIGCEGVIYVRPSESCDFQMRFFNPDGSEAALCGNGARCVAAFAREIGAAKGDRMRFQTNAGVIAAEILSPRCVRVLLQNPHDLRANFLNTGVPHAIVPVDALEAVDVAKEGRRLRYAPDYAPAGTNVDFVRFEDSSRLAIRTYERGVEAETFACGTGSVAAACVGVAQYGLRFPVSVMTSRGDILTVDGRFDGTRFESVSLTGPVCRVYAGEWNMV